MQGGCYWYKAGQQFSGITGIISGTTNARVDITVYDIRIACGVTHTTNNFSLGTTRVTLGGNRVASCFLIPAASAAFSGDGFLVVTVAHAERDNVTFDLQSTLRIK